MGPLIADGSRHNARPRFLPTKCILLPFATQPVPTRQLCFLGTNFSFYCPAERGPRDPRGGTDESRLSLLPPPSRARCLNDQPLGLGVRLPRFCIKVDSNPSEIFSLSRPPLPRLRSLQLRPVLFRHPPPRELSEPRITDIFSRLSDQLWTLGISCATFLLQVRANGRRRDIRFDAVRFRQEETPQLVTPWLTRREKPSRRGIF